MRIVDTVVFADGPGGGNPCPVVFDADGLSDQEMQDLAARKGHETAFLLEPLEGGDLRLRYFVPRHEMEMCVHASLAAAVLVGGDIGTIETPLGNRHVSVSGDRAEIEQDGPTFGPVVADAEPVLSALGADAATEPIRSVSTARPKLMVPLADEETLDSLTPDPERLWRLCDELEVTGFYPYCLDAARADAAARQFPRDAGYDEDPATGLAACALGAHLATEEKRSGPWRIAQGRAMGRPSLIETYAEYDGGRVVATRVGGSVARVS